MITPLTEDGQLDEPAMRRFVEYVIAGGVHGLVVLGSSGEAALLEPRTRMRALEVAVEAANGRVPVIAGTGEPGTPLAVETTRRAREIGATAAILVPPFYYNLDQEGVKRHFRTVREKGGLPLLAYHIPSLTKIAIQVETIVELATDGTICSMKDSSGEFGYYQRVVDGTRHLEYAALQGADSLLFSGMAYGGDGAISVMSQVAPKVMVGLYNAAAAGDWVRAREFHRRYQQMAEIVGPGWIPAVKGALSALGICQPHVAYPNLRWDDDKLAAQRARIEAALRDGLFEASVAPAAVSA